MHTERTQVPSANKKGEWLTFLWFLRISPSPKQPKKPKFHTVCFGFTPDGSSLRSECPSDLRAFPLDHSASPWWWLLGGWLVGWLAAWLVGWCNASYTFCWKSSGPNKNNKSYSWSLGINPCFTTTRQAVWSTWTCCSPVTLTSLGLAELEVRRHSFRGRRKCETSYWGVNVLYIF